MVFIVVRIREWSVTSGIRDKGFLLPAIIPARRWLSAVSFVVRGGFLVRGAFAASSKIQARGEDPSLATFSYLSDQCGCLGIQR